MVGLKAAHRLLMNVGANLINFFFCFLHRGQSKEDNALGDAEGIQDGSAERQEAGRSGTSTPLLDGQQSM